MFETGVAMSAGIIETHQRIFTDRYLQKKMEHFQVLKIPDFEKKLAKIKSWQEGIKSKRILKSKEEQLQREFLTVFFGDILGYEYDQGLKSWNLETEHKTVVDSTKADGALGFFEIDKGKVSSNVQVVIELKDAQTDLDRKQKRQGDNRSPVQQAFDYANAVGGTCRWVIVSNFLEIRLYYQNDRSRYESFEISQFTDDLQLKKFFYLLQKSRLINERGQSPVDLLYQERQVEEAQISKDFYREYTQARKDLFRHLLEQNPQTDPLVILNKTQKLLDRLMFIWFCEDFQIIPALTLRNLLKAVKEDRFNRSDSKIYSHIRSLFDAINHGYPEEGINKFNGGLFAGDPELDQLDIKDSTLEHIVSLEKYDFASDLNVNILGHIFEQSITDLEEMKSAIAEQDYDLKHGKRKQDGVFYTPAFITQYMIESTIGAWLEKQQIELGIDKLTKLEQEDYESIFLLKGARIKASANVKKHIKAWEEYRKRLSAIKIVDPSCGSGAFLNQAFDYLYREGQKVNETLDRLKLGQGQVFELDKLILSNNLYGVDLNPESVEITKLSLWLKTANRFSELTTLDHNILCGNSLISDEAYADRFAFDWERAFPEIMKNGGFDVVIGNPPYVRQELFSPIKPYLEENYQVYSGMADLFVYFFERGLKVLKPGGAFSFIVSNKFLKAGYGRPLTQFLQKNYLVKELIDFGDIQIFEGATTYPCIITIQNQAPGKKQAINYLRLTSPEQKEDLGQTLKEHSFPLEISESQEQWQFASKALTPIFEKAKKKGSTLDQLYGSSINRGVVTGCNNVFVIDEETRARLIAEDTSSTDIIKPFLVGKQVKRYKVPQANQYLIFTRRGIDINQYPAILKYLEKFRTALEPKPKGFKGKWPGRKSGSYKWYEIQDSIAYYEDFEKPKIFWPEIAQDIRFTWDEKGLYANNKAFLISEATKYLLGVLNSTLIRLFIHSISTDLQGSSYNFSSTFVKTAPIIPFKASNQDCKAIENAVEQMLATQKLLADERNKTLTFLNSELKVSTSKPLNSFWTLSWEDFNKELKKQKIKLDLSQKEDWLNWLNQKQRIFSELELKTQEIDQAIDQHVFSLYGINADEQAVLKTALKG